MKTIAIILTSGGLAILSIPAAAQVPPRITVQPSGATELEGTRVVVTAQVAGTAPIRVQWYWNGEVLPGATRSSIVLSNAHPAQSGDYQMVATNAFGTATSQVARVTIRSWAPMTGSPVPSMAAFDTNMQTLLLRYSIPGGALGVVKDGRLIHARGYGYADQTNRIVVQPDTLFQLASVSKSITAAAVMQLVDAGRLSLSNSAFGLLALGPAGWPGATNDPRLPSISVRQLLNHTAGWNRLTATNPAGTPSFEPWAWTRKAGLDLGLSGPANPAEVVRWMSGQPLQFGPGTQFQYSNVGYMVAARVIEKIVGSDYDDHVKRSLFRPLGITRMRLGAARLDERRSDETLSYLDPRGSWDPELLPAGMDPLFSDAPYAFFPRAIDGAGGWSGSVIDYLRFLTAIDGQASVPDILTPPSIQALTARSAPWTGAEGYHYGLGWFVYPSIGDIEHSGDGLGTHVQVMRLPANIAVISAFNLNPYFGGSSNFAAETYVLLRGTALNVGAWPPHNFFAATYSYEAWREKHFTTNELAQPDISGDVADPDGDSLGNWAEYVFGQQPKTPSPGIRPSVDTVEASGRRYLTLTYRRLMLGHEIDYGIEASVDLVHWAEITVVTEASRFNSDGTFTISVRDSEPIDAHQKRFLRLRLRRGE